MTSATSSGCFDAWRAWCRSRGDQRAKIGKLLAHAELRYFRLAFPFWRDSVAEAAQREIALARFKAKWQNQPATPG